MESRITKIEISLNDNERYIIEVTKRFAPEHGGGEVTIRPEGEYKDLHTALGEAKDRVTMSYAYREDFETEGTVVKFRA